MLLKIKLKVVIFWQIFARFDRLLLLAEGETAYLGEAKRARDFFDRLILELGTRQHCCDNVTMFSGQKCLIITLVSTFRH